MNTLTSTQNCESFRSWNRLEVRPRKEDFGDILQAKTYDPLWMLARQRQFGELQAEDTGSAILAKVALKTTRLARYQARNERVEEYNENFPLEAKAEAVYYDMDYNTRVGLGNQWFKMLKRVALLDVCRDSFLSSFPIQLPSIEQEDSEQDAVIKAQSLSNVPLTQFVAASTGRAIDGWRLYLLIKADPEWTKRSFITLQEDELTILLETINAYIEWVEECYYMPGTKDSEAWVDKQLEYEFKLAMPDVVGETAVLDAKEYSDGKLDWYSFDLKKSPDDEVEMDFDHQDFMRKNDEITMVVMPTEATFAGAPVKRFWEMENGKFDFGHVKTEETDLTKMLLAEYVTVYSNNWFVLPVQCPVGSLVELEGIVVLDVFGQQTYITPYMKNVKQEWNKWSFFNLTVNDELKQAEVDPRLFIPPSCNKIAESEAIEKVVLVRDEMSNMVYGVENRIANQLGGGTNAMEASGHLIAYLNDKYQEKSSIKDLTAAPWQYQIQSDIPENWIPFVPVRENEEDTNIHLQRAAMPRRHITEKWGTPGPVRPRTSLLRYGISSKNDQETPYFIDDQEIPKAGVILSSTYQRTRWINGQTVLWQGRRKSAGRGEGSSGLLFDLIKEMDQ